jgi:hypothetical protein
VELDIYYDPDGGRYYERPINSLLGGDENSGIPELLQPGMKIMHIPDVDYNTHYYTLKSAMQAIKKWSEQDTTHLPIVVLIEYKETGVSTEMPNGPFTEILPFTETAVDAVDQEIIDIFGANSSHLFKPDDLRQNYPDLKTAIQEQGWPKIADLRGKIIFVCYANDNYTKQHPNLEGRMMFQFSPTESPNAAFVLEDNANDITDIQDAVNTGAIVRTMADSETQEARTGNTTRRENAFKSGAQIIATDYYLPDPRAGQPGWTNYQVIFPTKNYARADVLNAPEIFKGNKIVE